jgi:hypothetical protein
MWRNICSIVSNPARHRTGVRSLPRHFHASTNFDAGEHRYTHRIPHFGSDTATDSYA